MRDLQLDVRLHIRQRDNAPDFGTKEPKEETALVPATWNHSGGSLKKYRASYAPPRRGRSMRIRRNRICNAIALALYSDSIINPPCTEH